MTPTQLPSGSWRLLVYIGKDASGKKIYKSVTRRTKKECLHDALEIQAHHKEVARDSGCMSLSEAIDAYISARDGVLSPSTIRGYRAIQRTRFQPEMALKLNRITREQWQRAVNRESKAVSAKSVANAWGLVNKVLDTYAEKVDGIRLPAKRKYEARYLTQEETVTLIRHIRGHKYELPILMLLALGIRRSEIAALQWEDFDPVHRTISINKALVQDENEQWVLKQINKTYESTRTLSVPDRVYELLMAMERKDGGRIYTHSPHNIYKHLDSLCAECGIDHIRLHDLRHTNASIMLALGIVDKYAMERGGWSSEQTMKKIYQHTFRTGAEEADNIMNAWFNAIPAPDEDVPENSEFPNNPAHGAPGVQNGHNSK